MRFQLWPAIAGTVACLVAAAGPYWLPVARMEMWTVDQRFKIRGPRESSTKVVVVAIDDKTLESAPPDSQWLYPSPFWGGAVAQTAQRCLEAGATVVGIDLLFSLDADTFLGSVAAQMEAPNLALAVFAAEHRDQIVLGRTGVSLPVAELVELVPDRLAAMDIAFGPDGAARSVARYVATSTERIPGFAELCAGGKTWNKVEAPAEVWLNDPGELPATYSAIDVDQGAVPSEALKGAIVLLAATYTESGDDLQLPLHGRVAGVYAQAIAAATLGDRRELTVPTDRQASLAAFLMSLVGLGLVSKGRFWQALGISFALGIAYLATSQAAFSTSDWVLPVAAPWMALWGTTLGGFGARGVMEARERDRIAADFGAQVSTVVAEYVTTHPKARRPVGVRGNAAVMFLDIRRFTTFSELNDPVIVARVLNLFFPKALAAVDTEGGYVQRFLGDGFLAVFGAPNTVEGPEADAMRAAEAICTWSEKFNRTKLAELGLAAPPDRWDIGIGIHSGPILMAFVGGKKRKEFSLVGDTVNTASRLQDLCKKLKFRLVVSERVALEGSNDGLEGPFDVELANKAGTFTVYRKYPYPEESS